MRVFKCGGCKTPFKVQDEQITSTEAIIVCSKCGAKNRVKFGVILLIQSKDKVVSYDLKEGRNIIGRKKSNDDEITKIIIDDQYVSKTHAAVHVEKKDDRLVVTIEDLNSTNGTFNKSKTKIKSKLKYPFPKSDYFILGLSKLMIK
jgi:pSer/pThr/pTyr-binding forkhead associated (FHA) protein